jgi:hypothetical protein
MPLPKARAVKELRAVVGAAALLSAGKGFLAEQVVKLLPGNNPSLIEQAARPNEHGLIDDFALLVRTKHKDRLRSGGIEGGIHAGS